MKIASVLIVLAGIILAFQNCGEAARYTGIVAQGQEILTSNSCPSGNCVQPADFLWLSIREYEPYKIELSTVNVGHFNVGGQCGVGNFTNHSFVWELREAFGQTALVGQGFADNRCQSGQFAVPIIPNQTLLLQPDQRYTLTMELVGVTDSNEEISNPSPANLGTLDIIFTSTPPN